MGKEWMALQGFNHRDNSIMATDPQVIPLGDVMGQDDSGGGSNS
jgi:3D (Asp-Asp-Asp) domain-containing protein